MTTALSPAPRPRAAPALLSVPWKQVRPMPGQPREFFDPEGLRGLAESIAAVGQQVPAKVVAVPPERGVRYELIDGQRRWHAVQLAGLPELRVEVVDEPDEDRRYAISVVANFARVAHHPIEIAVACDRMRRSMSVAKVAAALGRTEPWIYQHLSLLKLTFELQKQMHPTAAKDKRLNLSTALLLAPLTHDKQREAWEEMKAQAKAGLSLFRAAQAITREMPHAGPSGSGARPSAPSDHYRNFLNRAREAARYFDRYTDGQFRAFAGRRPSEETQSLRALLGRIERAASRLTDALDATKESP